MADGPARWTKVVTTFMARHVEAAGAKGLVLGLSGGLDSAVVAALAAAAVGPSRVLCFIMPAHDSDPMDAKHARLAARTFQLECLERPIGLAVDALAQSLPLGNAAVRGNVKARLRMLSLYAEAQTRRYLVTGTGNKSEILTGYFTKYGDGAADLQPIGDLYKTQVRELARHLGVPRTIREKAPSAGLYAGQTDEGEMGMSYDDLDAILRGLELNFDLATVARKTGLGIPLVEKVEAMVRQSEHKRHLALIPKLGARTVGIDWRRSVQWDA